MTDNNEIILTQNGFDDLKAELEERLSVVRTEIADEIEQAKMQGDLSENAAYEEAMRQKDFNEKRISDIENILKFAVIKKINTKNASIDIGEKFKLTNTKTKASVVYQLVGGNEANPQERKISIDSPIGAKVVGKKYGDKIKVDTQNGPVEFLIDKA